MNHVSGLFHVRVSASARNAPIDSSSSGDRGRGRRIIASFLSHGIYGVCALDNCCATFSTKRHPLYGRRGRGLVCCGCHGEITTDDSSTTWWCDRSPRSFLSDCQPTSGEVFSRFGASATYRCCSKLRRCCCPVLLSCAPRTPSKLFVFCVLSDVRPRLPTALHAAPNTRSHKQKSAASLTRVVMKENLIVLQHPSSTRYGTEKEREVWYGNSCNEGCYSRSPFHPQHKGFQIFFAV